MSDVARLTQEEYRSLQAHLPVNLNDFDHLVVGCLLAGVKEHLQNGDLSGGDATARLVARLFVVFRRELGGLRVSINKGITDPEAFNLNYSTASSSERDGSNRHEIAVA